MPGSQHLTNVLGLPIRVVDNLDGTGSLQVTSGGLAATSPTFVSTAAGTPLANSQTGAAAATTTATITPSATQKAYLSGFTVSCPPPAGVVSGTVTVNSVVGGPLVYDFVETVAAGGLLNVQFASPLAATAVNTPITVVLSAIASGAATHTNINGYAI